MHSVRVRVELDPPYEVRIGPDVRHEVASATSGRSLLVVDQNVVERAEPLLVHVAQAALVVVGPGESAKEFSELEWLLSLMAQSGLDRGSTVVALGGGATLDLAGLAAALYMRGIASVQCPTTLLARVDASVGGKTAVNLPEGKNLVGAFHQPRAVFADTRYLATLDASEFACGLGEVVKTAVIAGAEAFERLEQTAGALLARDEPSLVECIADCVRTKARVVVSDERESGPRKVLNLGHTFAHAIEHVAGYGTVPHGVAVGVGVALALHASRELGLLRDATLPERVERLLATLGLPRSLAELRAKHAVLLDPGALIVAMRSDKKTRDGSPQFVLIEELGTVRWDFALERELLARLLG